MARSRRLGRKLPAALPCPAHRCLRGDRSCLPTAQSRFVATAEFLSEQRLPLHRGAELPKSQPGLSGPGNSPVVLLLRRQCGAVVVRLCHHRTPAVALIRCLRDLSRLKTKTCSPCQAPPVPPFAMPPMLYQAALGLVKTTVNANEKSRDETWPGMTQLLSALP